MIGTLVVVACSAVVVSCAALWARADQPLNMADEAYLWYGTRAVRAGAQPLRDIRSYEPGRYWWCAVAARVFGDRLLVQRAAVHVWLGLAILAAGLALVAGERPAWTVAVVAATLGLWAEPQHKLFEPAVEVILVAAGTMLLIAPGPLSGAVVGATVGLAAIIGLNVAGYGAVATVVLVLLTPLHGWPGTAAGIAAGVVFGGLPGWWWLIRTPGATAALVHRRVTVPARRGTTNLPLPVPWPWRAPTRAVQQLRAPARGVVRWSFVLAPMLVAAVLVVAVTVGQSWRVAHAPAVAAAAVGLPVLHHAFSRADPNHLTQALWPAIVAAVALLGVAPAPVAGAGAVLLLAATAAVAHDRRRRADGQHPSTADGGPRMAPRHRALLDAVAPLVRDTPSETPVLAVPTLLGVLVLTGRWSAVTDTFCVYPATPEEDDAMVAELEASGARVAVIDITPLDGRSELSFPATHPRTWAHVQAQFTPRVLEGLPPGVEVFTRDGSSTSSG